MAEGNLTKRQADILARLQRDDPVKEIAKALGITDNGVYQTRRRLIQAGHYTPSRKSGRKSARKRRATSSRIAAAPAPVVLRADADPIAAIRNRVEIVKTEIEERNARVADDVAALGNLTDESKRLTKALRALTPTTNGSRKKTARKRSVKASA